MKKWLAKITGVAKVQEEAREAMLEAKKIAEDAAAEAAEAIKQAKKEEEKAKEEAGKAKEEAKKAAEEEELAKLSPKDQASAKGEPWVGVLETHVNKDNIRNGFFELDWNDEFVVQLRNEGYGLDGDKDEEVVDRWFKELCAGVVVEGGFDDFGPINTGSIDGQNINQNK